MDIFREIALITDSDVEQCVHRLLKALAVSDNDFRSLLASPSEMSDAIDIIGSGFGSSLLQSKDLSSYRNRAALRAILVTVADSYELRPRLEDLLSNRRKTLDPIASAIVLGGIFFILSLEGSVNYELKDGKRHVKVEVKRKATTENLLNHISSLFLPSTATIKQDRSDD